MGFWEKLPKPFFVLAPMADVTDTAFRQMIAKYSRHGEKGGGPMSSGLNLFLPMVSVVWERRDFSATYILQKKNGLLWRKYLEQTLTI